MQFIKRGRCSTVLIGPEQIATAIYAYLVAHGVSITGPRTVRWETPDDDTTECAVIVDPSGQLIDAEGNVR